MIFQRIVVVSFLLFAALSATSEGLSDEQQRAEGSPEIVLRASGSAEAAPHQKGNIYAPSVLLEKGLYRMWYGAQGADGHDRIFYALSGDGLHWIRHGLAIDRGLANHVNDPCVLEVEDKYYMFYTRAPADVIDEIALATSNDGVHWELQGTVLRPGKAGDWDSLLVGRPSVIHHAGKFYMWYDGRKDLPPGSPAQNVPISSNSRRHVGLATSSDGRTWTRHQKHPVFDQGAGAVDVHRFQERLVMLYESHQGTCVAVSEDGIRWNALGLRFPCTKSGVDRSGHVTPHLLILGDSCNVYFGAASVPTWNQNSIAVRRLPTHEFVRLLRPKLNSTGDPSAGKQAAGTPSRQRITLAQIYVTLDVQKNLARIRAAFAQAKKDHADWILFPEGALSGYYGGFDQAEVAAAFAEVRVMCREAGVNALLGTCWKEDGRTYNEIRILDSAGKFVGEYAKTCLTYGDAKQFDTGKFPLVHQVGGLTCGTLICNDMWVTPGYTDGPDPHLSLNQARAGAQVIFHAVNSGTSAKFRGYHESNLMVRSAEAKCPFVVVNAAHDEPINCASGIVSGFEYEVSLPRQGEVIRTVEFTPRQAE